MATFRIATNADVRHRRRRARRRHAPLGSDRRSSRTTPTSRSRSLSPDGHVVGGDVSDGELRGAARRRARICSACSQSMPRSVDAARRGVARRRRVQDRARRTTRRRRSSRCRSRAGATWTSTSTVSGTRAGRDRRVHRELRIARRPGRHDEDAVRRVPRAARRDRPDAHVAASPRSSPSARSRGSPSASARSRRSSSQDFETAAEFSTPAEVRRLAP